MNNTLFRWRAPLPPLKLSATVVVVVIAVAVAAVNAARDDTTVPANASETTTATAACALCRQYCSGGRDAVVDDVTTDASTDRTAQCACGIGCDGDRLSVPRDGGRKESRWCWTVIANLETVSIMFVFVTFNVYAWVLKQRGTSNHVKHYLAFFSILLSIRRFKRNFCPEQDPCDERPINVFGSSELFSLACTNYWQIVMCIEYLYFIRYIDKLNSFTTNISSRNMTYHVCCWLFSTLWTYLAFTLEIHQFNIPETNSSSIMYSNNWLSTVQLNYKYLFFFYVPGLINIVINIIILLLSIFIYKSKTKRDHFKSKGFEKLLIRKQLFVVLTFIWIVDVLAFIDQNNDQRKWLQTMSDVVKALNGTITSFILLFKHYILTEIKNNLQVYWHRFPYMSRRKISNTVCVNPAIDVDSNDDRCIL